MFTHPLIHYSQNSAAQHLNDISDELDWEPFALPLDLTDLTFPTYLRRCEDEGLVFTVEISSGDSGAQTKHRITDAMNVAFIGPCGPSGQPLGPPIELPVSHNPAEDRCPWVVVRAANNRAGGRRYYEYWPGGTRDSYYEYTTILSESKRGFIPENTEHFMFLGEHHGRNLMSHHIG